MFINIYIHGYMMCICCVRKILLDIKPRKVLLMLNSYKWLQIDWPQSSGVTEVDGALSHFLWWGPLGPWLNIRAKYVGNGAVNQDYYNTILFLVGAPNCWGPLLFDLTLPNGRYATAAETGKLNVYRL